MADLDGGNLARARRQIVRKRRRENVAGVVVNDLFQERIGNALGHPALDLSVDDHGVDQASRVLGHYKVFQDNPAGLHVDFDYGDMTRIGECARRIVGCSVGDAGTDLALEAMSLVIGRTRQRLDRDRAIRTGDAGGIGLEHNILGRGLQQNAGHGREFRADLARRHQCGTTGDDHGATGESAPAVWGAVGIAVHDLDAVGRCSELIRNDLRQRGAQPLTMGGCADACLDPSGGIHGHLDRFPPGSDLHPTGGKGRRAVAGALAERRQAKAQMPPLRTRVRLARAKHCNAGRLHRGVHGFDIARLIEHEPGGRGVGK